MVSAALAADVMRREHAYALLSSAAGMFSEACTFLLPDGGARTARALVQPGRSQLRDRQYESSSVEEIDVRVAKDPAAVAADGEAIGGLALTEIGQGLALNREGESEGRLCIYRFKIEETKFTWLLRFEYDEVQRIGSAHAAK